jgi:hypothetical protein
MDGGSLASQTLSFFIWKVGIITLTSSENARIWHRHKQRTNLQRSSGDLSFFFLFPLATSKLLPKIELFWH